MNTIKMFKIEIIAVLIAIFIAIIAGMNVELVYTGYSFIGQVESYKQDLNLSLNQDHIETISLTHPGQLRSITLKGRFADEGRARAYLKNGETAYLILDTHLLDDSIAGITGYVVADLTEENQATPPIDNIITRISGSGSTDYDGIYQIEPNSYFSWDANTDYVCAHWTINADSICRGDENCCLLFEESAQGKFNDPIYLTHQRYGEGNSNFITLQTVYANYSLDVENPFSDIVYSNVATEEIVFSAPYRSFDEVCFESCNLKLNESTYQLVFMVENTSIELDSFSYSLVNDHNVSENIPNMTKILPDLIVQTGEDIILDLNDYFEDSDGDELAYVGFIDASPGLLIDESVATITLDDYIGEVDVFFVANDGFYTAVSNTFRITVIDELFENVSVDEFEEEPVVRINTPVKWTKRINATSNRVNATIALPKGASNVTVVDNNRGEIVESYKLKIKEGAEVKDLAEYESEQRLEQLEKVEDRLREKRDTTVLRDPSAKADIGSINRDLLSIQNEKNRITGLAIYDTDSKGIITRFFEWLLDVEITGYAILDLNETTDTNTTLVIEDVVEDVSIEFYTEAPISEEFNISGGKEIVISSDTHYENIIAYSYIVPSQETEFRLVHTTGANYTQIIPETYDTNGDGLIDYIEWIVPHLSNQSYEIIYISDAQLLDTDRNFVENILSEVEAHDAIWTDPIGPGEYVRVTFEKNLSSVNDITVYARSEDNQSGSIEVYEKDSDDALGVLSDILEESYYKMYLTNLVGTASVFDLKIIGSLALDYIVDPPTVSLNSPEHASAFYNTSVAFNCSAFDGGGISNLTLYWNYTGSWVANDTVHIGGELNSTNFTKINLNDSVIEWNCRVCNVSNNCSFAATNFTFIVDTLIPSFSENLTNASSLVKNGNISFNISLSDQGAGLSNYIFSWNGTGVWENNSNGTVQNVTDFIHVNKSSNLTGGSIIGYRWYFNDSASNWNATLVTTFTVVNVTPVVPIVYTPGEGELNNTIALSFSSYDTDGDEITYWIFINDTLNITTTYNITDWNASDGSYNMTVVATDGNEFSENSSNVSFILDRTGPAVTIWYPPNNLNISAGQIDLNVSAVDSRNDTFTYYFVVNDTINSTETEHNTTFNASDGIYNVTIFVYDGINNGSANITVRFDTIAPNFVNNDTNASFLTIDGNATFNITFEDEGGVNFYIFSWNGTGEWENNTNGSIGGTSSGVSITKTTNLSYGAIISYRWYVNDSAGNLNASILRNFSVANALPLSPIVHTPGADTINNTLTINVSAIEPDNQTLTFNIYINSSLNATTTYNLSIWNATDGYYNITVSAFDGIDWGPNSTPQFFRIDTTPPVASIIYPQDAANISVNTIDINASAYDERNDSLIYTWVINGTTNFTTVDVNASMNASDGYYNLTLFVSDGLQNGSTNVSFRFDTIAPGFSLNVTNATSMKINGNASFNITATDEGGMVRYIFSWNGTGVWDNHSNGTIEGSSNFLSVNKSTNLSQGNNVAYLWYVNDSAGNLNISQLRSFFVNNSIPTHTIPAISSADTYNRTTGALTCSPQGGNDDDSDTITYSYRWFNNSLLLDGETTNTLAATNFEKHDNLSCEVTPTDSIGTGTPLNSTTLMILNTNLTISLQAPANSSFTIIDSFNFTYNISDDDGIFDITVCYLQLDINQTGSYVLNNTNYIPSTWNNVSYNLTYEEPKDETINWFVNCTDTSNSTISSDIWTLDIDNFRPTQFFYYPNRFNSTAHAFSNETIDLNITIADYNLTNVTLIVLNSTRGQVYINASPNLSGIPSYTLGYSLNISNWSSGNYTFHINSTDVDNNNLSIDVNFRLNTIPNVSVVSLASSDLLNRTNESLTGSYTYSDVDVDAEVSTEIQWYNDTFYNSDLDDSATIGFINTRKYQNWTFSIRVFDGLDYSLWANASNLTILNSPPYFHTPVPTLNVSSGNSLNVEAVNITDIDNDTITYYSNNSIIDVIARFVNDSYINESDVGTYSINISADDGEVNVSQTIVYNVTDATPPTSSELTNNATAITRVNAIVNWSVTLWDGIGLHTYTFGFNDSGTLIYDAPLNISGTEHVINVTKQITAAHGYVCANITFNDTSANINSTNSSCFYVENTPATNLTSLIINTTVELNLTNESLHCYFTCEDFDNDTLSYDIQWFKDGIIGYNETGISCINGTITEGLLAPENTSKHENWSCSVRIYDEYNYSNYVNSTLNITIRNSIPAEPIISYPLDNQNYSSIEYVNFSGLDVDNDNLTFTLYIDGVLNATDSGNISIWNATDGYYNLTITSSDSEISSNNSTVVYFRLDSTQPTFALQERNTTPHVNEDVRMNITIIDDNCHFYSFFWNETGNLTNSTAQSCTAGVVSTTFEVREPHQNLCWGYWVNDTAGNSNTSELDCFNVSNTGPGLVNLTSPSIYEVNNTITIEFLSTDLDNDSLTYSVYINSSLNFSGNYSIDLWNASDGYYNLTISAHDGRNTSANLSPQFFTLDTTTPTVTIIYPTDALNISSNRTDLNVSAIDRNDSLTYYWVINGTVNSTTTDANSSLTGPDGYYNLTAFVSDGLQNGSSTVLFRLDTTYPVFSGNETDAAGAKVNNNITFNITATDTVGLDYYIFSWNGTGEWDNNSNGTLDSSSTKLVINKTNTLGQGNTIGYVWYVNDSAGNMNISLRRIVTISNTNPTQEPPQMGSTTGRNLTNETIWCNNNSLSDSDGDTLTALFDWYKGDNLTSFNQSFIPAINTSKGDVWRCSINVSDGLLYNISNSTNLTILNAPPFIQDLIPNVTATEGELINQTLNITDHDNDTLIFSTNSTLIGAVNYTLNATSATGVGTYLVNVSVSDGNLNDSQVIKLTINSAEPEEDLSVLGGGGGESSESEEAEEETEEVVEEIIEEEIIEEVVEEEAAEEVPEDAPEEIVEEEIPEVVEEEIPEEVELALEEEVEFFAPEEITPELKLERFIEDVDFDPQVSCIPETSEQEIVVETKNILEDIDVPEGFELVMGPMDITCGEPFSMVVNVPTYFEDLRVLKCSGADCFSQIVEISKTTSCGEDTEEVIERRTIDPELLEIEILESELSLGEAENLLQSGNNKFEFAGDALGDLTAKLEAPSEPLEEAKNPGLKIIGPPIVVVIDGNKKLDSAITLEYTPSDNVFPDSPSIYAQVGENYEFLGGVVDQQSHTVTANVSDLLQYRDDEGRITLAVMGVLCENCIDSTLKVEYEPEGGSETAVLLVHGLASAPATFNDLINDITQTNQPFSLITFGYSSSRSIEEITPDFIDLVGTKVLEYDHVVIVAHSLGGIVTQNSLYESYKTNMSYLDRIKEVIIIGTPNQGSAVASAYEDLFKLLVNRFSKFNDAFSINSKLIPVLVEGRNVPQVPSIKYNVIAGTEGFEGGALSLLAGGAGEEDNDGLVTVESAQSIGGVLINDMCSNYWEVNVSHNDLIHEYNARQIIGRIIRDRVPEDKRQQASFGNNKYYTIEIDDCTSTIQYAVIGKRIEKVEKIQTLGCSCGDNVCGMGESSRSCPGDCAKIIKEQPSPVTPWVIGGGSILTVAGVGYFLTRSLAFRALARAALLNKSLLKKRIKRQKIHDRQRQLRIKELGRRAEALREEDVIAGGAIEDENKIEAHYQDHGKATEGAPDETEEEPIIGDSGPPEVEEDKPEKIDAGETTWDKLP